VAMKMSRSGVIVSNIGMMLLGVVPAILLARGIGWLWPEMRLPVFFAVFLCWVTGGITVILRDRGKREISAMSWSTGREYTTFSSLTSILSNVATMLFGVVLASFIAGFVGLFWPGARWPVSFVALVAWVAVGISIIVGQRTSQR
jgi:hypothetical protein